MAQIILTPAQRKDHRADAHHLDAVVMIGSGGLTAAVKKEVDAALNAHGLIKVRAQMDDRSAREAVFQELSIDLNAAPIQHIGKLLVLWRPMPEKAKPEREERKPGPRIVKLVSFSKSGNHRATVKKVQVFGNQRVAAGGEIKRARVRVASPKKKARD